MKNATEIQLQILGILTAEGSRTINDLAKKLAMKPHVVRYQLDQLLERRRIERAVMLNQRALGQYVFNVLFDLPRASIKRTLDFLERRTEVSWLAQNMGLRKFEVTFFAKDMVEGANLVHSMGEAVGVHFRDPIFALEVETRHWGLRFLTGREATKPVAHFVSARVLTQSLRGRAYHGLWLLGSQGATACRYRYSAARGGRVYPRRARKERIEGVDARS